MENDKVTFQGYKGRALEMLKKYDVHVWDKAEVETTRGHFSGKILPRAENTDDIHIVMKVATGYNIGIDIETVTDMKGERDPQHVFKIPEKEFPYTPGLPHVKLLGTGGTIASRLDYRTGAVIPAFSPGELYGAVPELADICNLETEKVFAVFSENMSPTEYMALANKIGDEIKKGIEGIVIGHGTDTLAHTATALTYMCQNLPMPVVLVGSQRSSDRPSSDAALNLMHAMTAAGHGDIAENVDGAARRASGCVSGGAAVRAVLGKIRTAGHPRLVPAAGSPGGALAALAADGRRRTAAAMAAVAALAVGVAGPVTGGAASGAAVAAVRGIAACRRQTALAGDVERHVARQLDARARADAAADIAGVAARHRERTALGNVDDDALAIVPAVGFHRQGARGRRAGERDVALHGIDHAAVKLLGRTGDRAGAHLAARIGRRHQRQQQHNRKFSSPIHRVSFLGF